MKAFVVRARVVLVAVLAAGLATACAPPKEDSGLAANVPTQDVVSAVRTDPALHASLPAAVRSRGTITVGITRTPGANNLPHGGTVGGRLVGLDVDLRNAVGRVLGVGITIEYGTFPTIIPSVQNGRYDVGQANFGVTAERSEVVDFSTYLDDGQAFLGSPTSGLTSVDELTDLCGKTVATSPGSTFQQILQAGADKCAEAGRKKYTVQYFTDTAPIFLGLVNGRIDAFFGPTLSLRYDEQHIEGTTFLGQLSSTRVGFVTRKGSALARPLTAAVNKLIASGEYGKIFAKWGVADIGIARSQVNPAPTL